MPAPAPKQSTATRHKPSPRRVTLRKGYSLQETMPEPRQPLMPLQLPGLPPRRLEPQPWSFEWAGIVLAVRGRDGLSEGDVLQGKVDEVEVLSLACSEEQQHLLEPAELMDACHCRMCGDWVRTRIVVSASVAVRLEASEAQ